MIKKLIVLTLVATGVFFAPVIPLHQRGDHRIVYWQCATVLVYGLFIIIFLRSKK